MVRFFAIFAVYVEKVDGVEGPSFYYRDDV